MAMLCCFFQGIVNSYFAKRKWIVGSIQIRGNEKDGKKEFELAETRANKIIEVPKHLPDKIRGFGCISITFLDQKVIEFLRHFHRLFDTCQIKLSIGTSSNLAIGFFYCFLWPRIKNQISFIEFRDDQAFSRMRDFVPSIFNELPSLRIFESLEDPFPAFPAIDSTSAAHGQLLAHWLIKALPNEIPKIVRCSIESTETVNDLPAKIGAIKSAFSKASFFANFIIQMTIPEETSIAPFDVSKKKTGRRLLLDDSHHLNLLLISCPIKRDKKAWIKWREEALQGSANYSWNLIDLTAGDTDIGEWNSAQFPDLMANMQK
ncbi:hypothetical protein niasHT_017773 [Heterodera trifolii]|uniref:Uncharacterized protein n=1 Tax=Heterodera trifolii TaxID=157864 RepID=A0ABD2LJF8_9BILA